MTDENSLEKSLLRLGALATPRFGLVAVVFDDFNITPVGVSYVTESHWFEKLVLEAIPTVEVETGWSPQGVAFVYSAVITDRDTQESSPGTVADYVILPEFRKAWGGRVKGRVFISDDGLLFVNEDFSMLEDWPEWLPSQ